MRRSCCPLLLALVGCAAPPADSSAPDSPSPGSPAGLVPGTTTGSPPLTSWPVLSWDGPPSPVDPGPVTHHATVAWAPDGVGWVAYQADGAVRVTRFTGGLVHDSAPLAFDHPQLAAAGDRVIGLSPLSGGGLNASVWGLDGTSLGDPLWLEASAGAFPDLGLTDDEGIAAWSEGTHIGCAHLGVHLGTHTAVPCPGPLDPARTVSTLAVDLNGSGGWLVWSEATLGSPATLVLAPLGLTGASSPAVVGSVVQEGFDARPDVVVTETGGLLAWRGSDGPVAPQRAWVAGFTSPTDVGDPVALGSGPGDRPHLATAAGAAAVVWDQPDGLWLQWLDPATGAPQGDPLEVATVQSPTRGNLALQASGPGWKGLISWEVDLGNGAREVRTRTFTAF